MLKKVDFKNIIQSKTSVGIEVILLPDNAYEINVVVLKKIKSILITEKQKHGISFEELAQFVNPRLPIILVLNGKGIIHRKISFSESDTPITMLNKVLPNANPNEFDLQQTIISSSQIFVSLIRSNIINEVIEQLRKNKLTNVAGCLLGPFVINNLLPLINTDIISNEQLRFGTYQLQIREQQITEITIAESEKLNESILIGEDQIHPKLVIPFAAALSYFLGTDAGIAKSEVINSIKKEFEQKQKFEFIGWSLLITAFSVLLVNYFVFNHYWTKTMDLSSKLASNQSALYRYDTLKVEFAEKRDFLEQNGLLESSRTSFYADRLAGSLPSLIQWIDVNIHPVKKKQVNDETEGFFFENKSIKISGKCQKSTDLNDWMKVVKLKSWVSSVTLLNYTQDKASDDGLFLIEIKLIN